MKLQLLLSKFMMGSVELKNGGNMPTWIFNILNPIFSVLQSLLLPVIIILGIAGMVYAIVLGVQFARAESSDQRDAAKKRLINAVIGVVIMLVALIAMFIFVQNAPEIFNWVEKTVTETEQ